VFPLFFSAAEEGAPRATGVGTGVTAWIQTTSTLHSHVWDRNICIYPREPCFCTAGCVSCVGMFACYDYTDKKWS